MKLNALVMSRNPGAVKALVTAFAELGIEYRTSFSASETMEILAQGRHSALVLDFDAPHATQIAKMARTLNAKHRPVLFGMIGAASPIAELFEAGGNFALYKPLDFLQILHSFRAAEAFMQQDRREASRHRGETIAYLELPGATLPALVQDLTEHGISIQAAEPLVPMRGLSLRFVLPETTQVIHATGDFIWADKAGRAGLFFTNIPAACRRDLQAWLRKRNGKKSQAARAIFEVRAGRRPTAAAH
jgi:PilZ domain